MIYRFKNIFQQILNIFGFTTLTGRIVDEITNTNTKQKMFMAIFSLHAKYFDVVNFDYLFLDILDRIFSIEFYNSHCSYLDIASEIIADNEISEHKLRNVLLNWIYNEPFFTHQLLMETPQATVELQPTFVEATMV